MICIFITEVVICKLKVINAKYFSNLNWDTYIKQFGQYLKLERSLSQNSIDAYVRDVEKLKQFVELSGSKSSPIKISSKELQKFIHYINELGMSAYSQARILSGLKAFFKYLTFEEIGRASCRERV